MAEHDLSNEPIFGIGTAAAVPVEGVAGGVAVDVTFPAGTTGDVNVAEWGGVATTLGQKVMASSVPVVIASDQSAVQTNLVSWGSTATTLGQKTTLASVPVVQASGTNAEILASAVRAATTNSPAQTASPGMSGLIIWLIVTANPGGGQTLSLNLQLRDSAAALITSNYLNFGIISTAANGTFLAVTRPGLLVADAGTAIISSRTFPLPRNYGVQVVHSGAGNWTYSLSVQEVP